MMHEAVFTYTGEDFPYCPWCGSRIDPPFDVPEGEVWRGKCDNCGSEQLHQYEEDDRYEYRSE
jgi:hypothetical protein